MITEFTNLLRLVIAAILIIYVLRWLGVGV